MLKGSRFFPAHFNASATGEASKFETVSLAILLVKAAECYLDLETTGSNKIHQCIPVYVLQTVYIYNTYNTYNTYNIPVYIIIINTN